MGEIVRRVMEGFEPVAEWSADDPDSFAAAQKAMQEGIDDGLTAVLSEDGHNEPITELPIDAERVILTTAMGGG